MYKYRNIRGSKTRRYQKHRANTALPSVTLTTWYTLVATSLVITTTELTEARLSMSTWSGLRTAAGKVWKDDLCWTETWIPSSLEETTNP